MIRHDVTEPIKLEVDRIWHLACRLVHYTVQSGEDRQNQFPRHVQHAGAGTAGGGALLLASTSEVYGDPEVHPQPESYRGVESDRHPQLLRRGQAHCRDPLFDYQRMSGVE